MCASGDRCPVGGDSAFAARQQLLYPVLDQLPGLPAPQSAALGAGRGVRANPRSQRRAFLVAVAVLILVSEVCRTSDLEIRRGTAKQVEVVVMTGWVLGSAYG